MQPNDDTPAAGQPLYTLLGCAADALPEPERYFVLRKLGAGGMGSVFLGRDEKLGRDVAVKTVLPGDGELHAEALRRFHREARSVAALNHAGIIRVFDYSGPALQTPYIIMERLSGAPLQAAVDRGPIPERVTVAIAHELAAALAHAHAAGVLHRDIKPENIFLEPDGRVVLIDFGLAKGLLADSDRRTLLAGKTSLVGTPAFSSPEQLASDAPLTAKSDLFALGSTLYYALTQVFPFRGETVFEVMREVMRGEALPLKELVEVSPAFEALIGKLLQKEPGDRPDDAARVQAALRPLLSQHKLRVPAVEIARWLKDGSTQADTQTGVRIPAAESTRIATVAAQKRFDRTPAPEPEATRVVSQTRIVTAKAAARTSPSAPQPRRANRTIMLVLGGIALAALGVTVALLPRRPRAADSPPPSHSQQPPTHAATPAPAVPEPAAESVRLRVSVTPWGKVSIDGKLMGTTPSFGEISLPAGAHEVEISHPKLGTRKERVVLPAGEASVELEVDLTQKR